MTTKPITRIVLQSLEPDEKGRFSCFVDGYMESLSIARIREAIEDGTDVITSPEVERQIAERAQ